MRGCVLADAPEDRLARAETADVESRGGIRHEFGVHVRVLEPGQQRATVQVDHAGLRTDPGARARIVADVGDALTRHGECGGTVRTRAHRLHHTADENRRGRRAREHRRRDQRHDPAQMTCAHVDPLARDP